MLKKIFTSIDRNQFSYFKTLRRWETGNKAAGTQVVVGEDAIATSLRVRFPHATFIEVNDVSGGCGAMFEVTVEAPDFKGLSIVKQHQLVTTALNKEIKDMHGIRIQTSVSSTR